MKKDFVIDYLGCILFRLISPLIRIFPLGLSLFLGRRLGDIIYYFDLKHKAVAYANIKTALGENLSPLELKKLTRNSYRAFGQNLVEIFMIPLVDNDYMNKYITFEGLDNIAQGFKRGKGVILLGAHEGSWELSNVICARLGFPFVLFAGAQQKFPRLNNLLNSYRLAKGCTIITREGGLKQLIRAFKNNQAIGMTVDQGGRAGILVKFFGKEASVASGAVSLALKYDATLLVAFYARVSGPRIKVIIEPAFKIKKTGDAEKDTRDNLQEVVHIFEKHIRQYPHEYLWTYKIWKYGREKNIIILDDGKAGHLRQAQAAAKIVTGYLKDKNIKTNVQTLEVKFKNKFAKHALTLASSLAGKYHCQGCLWCLKTFLSREVYKALISKSADVLISCGSSLAAINYVLSRENLAKSIVILRPSILSTARFNLVIMPQHDKPPRRKNIALTEGALNLVDEGYLKDQSERLLKAPGSRLQAQAPSIGLLLGGDTKDFKLDKSTVAQAIKEIKELAERINLDILVTTSRRTPGEIEELVKNEFKDFPRCKLLIIANEKNIPEAVGGILGLSKIVVVSADSISMISEAASSAKYIIVFNSKLNLRHRKFLNYMAKSKYIYQCLPQELSSLAIKLWESRPPIKFLQDKFIVQEALKKIF